MPGTHLIGGSLRLLIPLFYLAVIVCMLLLATRIVNANRRMAQSTEHGFRPGPDAG